MVADSGYADAEQIQHCEDAGITPFVPHPRSSNTKGEFFSKSQFVYEEEQDQYRCPAGEILRFPRLGQEAGEQLCGGELRGLRAQVTLHGRQSALGDTPQI